jgi:hypothetical protein
VNLVLGIWLVVAPWMGVGASRGDAAAWNSYCFGVAIIIFAMAAMSARGQVWEEWITLMIGLWLIIAPFALHFTDQRVAMWNQTIVGVVVGVVALWAGVRFEAQRHRHA